MGSDQTRIPIYIQKVEMLCSMIIILKCKIQYKNNHTEMGGNKRIQNTYRSLVYNIPCHVKLEYLHGLFIVSLPNADGLLNFEINHNCNKQNIFDSDCSKTHKGEVEFCLS